MYINQFTRMARVYFDAGVSVQLRSSPGIGKSETIAYLAEEFSRQDNFEWGFGSAFLATYTPSDLLGFMVPGKMLVEGKETRVSEFTMPPWMMATSGRPLNEYKRGILLLDEYDKAEPDVKRASAELLLNGCIGQWRLHDGIAVVACSNRAEDRSGSTKDYDFVINRRLEIELKPDLNSWKDWAAKHAVNPMFVTFAMKNAEVVFGGKVPDKQGPFCTPRSLVNLSLIFDQFEAQFGKKWLDDKELKLIAGETAIGKVGEGAALSLMTWMDMRLETPDIEEIVADPVGTKIPAKPDAKMLTAYECAHRATHATIKPIVEYIMRYPAEFAVTFGVSLCKRDHTMLATAPMREFIKKNTALMNAVGA